MKYEPNTGANLVHLKREFTTSKLDSAAEDPEVWISKLEKLRSKIDQLGSKITDDDLLIHILNNLPVEYETVVENSEKQMGKGLIDLEELKVDLRAKYNRLKVRVKSTEKDQEEQALFVKKG